MTKLTCIKFTFLTVSAVVIQIIGLSLFVFGFFPVKPALSGISGPESFYAPGCDSATNRSERGAEALPADQLKLLYQELSGIPPLFDRLVLMVVDGLPAEFVLGKEGQPPRKDLAEAMPYTQYLLANGMAVGYHARAAPPTVTMPRLKAMVSGAIGGFLDVAFNFNTQALLDDNLLGQFSRIGWKMVMLGDDTWLKLFPGLFVRHDGVSSFYVKDTVQVDHNVSRHLGNELNRDDWNFLILHYLGLDHVGHIGGRNSVLMAPKLLEMDEVVKMIHLSAIQTQDDNGGQTLLVVVSDHGMTENGNHGGSSNQEIDSLALFIGLKNGVADYASTSNNYIQQVDIAPTLALLFGVPIPKNNVGVLIAETINYLTDDKQLRALELNSMQLLRLLQAQLPGLSCAKFPCYGLNNNLGPINGECCCSMEEKLCCLLLTAANLHGSWKSKKDSWDDFSGAVAAYREFLKTASDWLSRRVTDKSVGFLAFGLVAMAISSLLLLLLIICLARQVNFGQKQYLYDSSNKMNSFHQWPIDEAFVLSVALILVISMGSSSMIEEEQYIWQFVISTSYLLLLRKTLCLFPTRSTLGTLKLLRGQNMRSNFQLFSIIWILFSGRILRGWHQGGVNWTYLPDIAKWLEQAGIEIVKSIHVASAFLVIALGALALCLLGSGRKIVQGVGFCFLTSGLLVLFHIVEYQDSTFASANYGATILAQIIYAILGIFAIGTIVAVPWLIPLQDSDLRDNTKLQYKSPLLEFRDSSRLTGLACLLCWCLLQLLLQQPINAMPIFLLLLQVLTSMVYYAYSGPQHGEWVEVALLCYVGMAGHFALGNSNTLATIDVAGAFIGLSSHSTLLSGILMFIITYASPMLSLLSMMMYISVKYTGHLATFQNVDVGHLLQMMLGLPSLIPLGLNSILLTAYTVVLLLMRNHLFVWSVFSPKYLYVCATTVCIYIGVFVVAGTEIYAYLVLAARRKRKMQASIGNGIR